MSNLVFNEQTKLFATALDRVSTACFTVGVLAPVAGTYFNLTAFDSGGLGWCCVARRRAAKWPEKGQPKVNWLRRTKAAKTVGDRVLATIIRTLPKK